MVETALHVHIDHLFYILDEDGALFYFLLESLIFHFYLLSVESAEPQKLPLVHTKLHTREQLLIDLVLEELVELFIER